MIPPRIKGWVTLEPAHNSLQFENAILASPNAYWPRPQQGQAPFCPPVWEKCWALVVSGESRGEAQQDGSKSCPAKSCESSMWTDGDVI